MRRHGEAVVLAVHVIEEDGWKCRREVQMESRVVERGGEEDGWIIRHSVERRTVD